MSKKLRENAAERAEGNAGESAAGNKKKAAGLSRRALLKGTAAGAALQALVQGAGGTILAAGAGLAGAADAHAQATGLEPREARGACPVGGPPSSTCRTS